MEQTAFLQRPGSLAPAGPSPSCRPSPARGDPGAPAHPSGPVSSQEKSKRLEVELDEERTTVELLTERVNRSRDQVWHTVPPPTRLVPRQSCGKTALDNSGPRVQPVTGVKTPLMSG